MRYPYLYLLFHGIIIVQSRDWIPKNWKDYIPLDIQRQYLGKSNLHSTQSGALFEGDIKGVDKAVTGIALEKAVRNVVKDEQLRWPIGIVPYRIADNFDPQEVQTIKRAMKLIMEMTFKCIKFIERTDEVDYVTITKGTACNSAVGRQGGEQNVELAPGCLLQLGNSQHELMHVLGFLHEQSRKDRDKYIYINKPNIGPNNLKVDFAKYMDADTYNMPYDYTSVMHYPITAFALDDHIPTIVPKMKGARIGQRVNMSPLDVAKIQLAYKCGTANPDKIESGGSLAGTNEENVRPQKWVETTTTDEPTQPANNIDENTVVDPIPPSDQYITTLHHFNRNTTEDNIKIHPVSNYQIVGEITI